MADFGLDLRLLPDKTFTRRSGTDLLVELAVRRLSTPRGGLFYDPLFGFDLREFIQDEFSDVTRFELEDGARRELIKIEGVLDAAVNASARDDTITVTCKLELDEGPFQLVLRVEAATVEVLRANLE
ncbi:MAG: hypothetical protein HC933_12465 [Pleurocapsa sp. SU_196_0]|nr:hypothetical protein [Pleurocapsa sp. SU_196_0]